MIKNLQKKLLKKLSRIELSKTRKSNSNALSIRYQHLRLIFIDKQGITGNKTEYKSISYKSISRFSIETAGTFELDAELKIWISSESHPSITNQFNKSVNVYEVQKLLAFYVLK